MLWLHTLFDVVKPPMVVLLDADHRTITKEGRELVEIGLTVGAAQIASPPSLLARRSSEGPGARAASCGRLSRAWPPVSAVEGRVV
mgnify:CR=1 FL=1